MEIRNLSTFLKVTELQNFSKAAETLGYSQSAVTVQIQQLEKELGVKLFDRIGKNVSITQYGREFIAYARDVVAAVSRASSFATVRENLTGQIKVGTLLSLMDAYFADILPEYHNRFPKVSTALDLDSVANIHRKLEKNELDLVFTLDYRTWDLQWIKIMEEEESILIVTNSIHPLAKKESVSLEEVLEEPFVLMPRSTSYRDLFDKELARHGRSVEPFLELDSTQMVLRLLENNPYISVLPRYTVQSGLEDGTLVALPVEECQMKLWKQLVYHRNKAITPQIQGMIDVILELNGKQQTK